MKRSYTLKHDLLLVSFTGKLLSIVDELFLKPNWTLRRSDTLILLSTDISNPILCRKVGSMSRCEAEKLSCPVYFKTRVSSYKYRLCLVSVHSWTVEWEATFVENYNSIEKYCATLSVTLSSAKAINSFISFSPAARLIIISDRIEAEEKDGVEKMAFKFYFNN